MGHLEQIGRMGAMCVEKAEALKAKIQRPNFSEIYESLIPEFHEFRDYYSRLLAVVESTEDASYGRREFVLQEGSFFWLETEDFALCFERMPEALMTEKIGPKDIPAIFIETDKMKKGQMLKAWASKIKENAQRLNDTAFEMLGIVKK